MPLYKIKLAKDIKKALDKMESKGKKKAFKKSDDPHEFLGKEIKTKSVLFFFIPDLKTLIFKSFILGI